jgi:hypothetical protein
MKNVLTFIHRHDQNDCDVKPAATLGEALDELFLLPPYDDDVDIKSLIPSDAESFDWKEYGFPDATQVSWGERVGADFDGDLACRKDGSRALFVNGVEVWSAKPPKRQR